MDQQQLDRAALDTWAIIEMFGHKRVAGKVSEHVLGSAVLVRVDVPESLVQRRGGVPGEMVTSPAFTKLIGPSSIYCLTPCSEEVARRAAQEFVRWDPPIPVEFQPQLPASVSVEMRGADSGAVLSDEEEDEFNDFGIDDDEDTANTDPESTDVDDVTDTPADREDTRDQHPFAGGVEQPRSPDAEASLPL